MTFAAISIFVDDAAELSNAIERAERAGRAGARLVEWRIDELAEQPDAGNAVKRLLADSPLPCILTCRPSWEGGAYSGPEDHRCSLLCDAITSASPPRYVDVELKTWQENVEFRRLITEALDAAGTQSDRTPSLMLSSHDYQQRPRDLFQRIEQMTAELRCDVIKVAWTARSLRDNLEAFDLLSERIKPTIALCMGPFGLMSRLLAPKFGGLLTFVTDEEDAPTAPGQPTIDDLLLRYRFNTIDESTAVYGVIGWPVSQSSGPAIHNAGFEAIDHNAVYLPLPVPPEYEHLKATLIALTDHPRLNFRGASITIPHKQNILRFVEEQGGRVDSLARRIGAANTLVIGSAGGMECINTDAPAAIDALCTELGDGDTAFRGREVVIFGAGGAARALAVVLMDRGANVLIVNRNHDRAVELVEQLQMSPTIGSGPDAASGTIATVLPAQLADYTPDVVINCTPIGMTDGPAPDQSPLDVVNVDPESLLNDQTVVFDTVYNPRQTPLLKQASDAGATTIPGSEMFTRQAALQFHAWTGKELPGDVVAP